AHSGSPVELVVDPELRDMSTQVRAVDLGLGDKRFQGKDAQMILAITCKLLLSLDMQVRGLRSIMLDCTQLPTNHDYVQQGYAETKKWNEKFQKLKDDGFPRRSRLAAAGKQSDLETVEKYCPEERKVGQLLETVKFVRLKKMHDSELRRLEVNVREPSDSYEIYMIMKADMLTITGSAALTGIAPPGDLNQKIQGFINK
ncbi:unnamed protein product, partial [Prorocentrum cordatum]